LFSEKVFWGSLWIADKILKINIQLWYTSS